VNDEPKRGSTLLVNLSGGVDSTFYAWRLLSEGWPLLLHHVRMVNREGRAEVEQAAFEGVCGWLRGRGLGRFSTAESGVDLSGVAKLPMDVEVVGWFTGVLLWANSNVSTVVVSANRDDVSIAKPQSARVVRRRKLAELQAGRSVGWWAPFGHMSKAQMVEAMPPELLALTWWCRKPQSGRVCRRCRVCREMQSAKQRLALTSGSSPRS
jgi:7-cyano-7-deazaguanine synthase in queuosine biosynthesis